MATVDIRDKFIDPRLSDEELIRVFKNMKSYGAESLLINSDTKFTLDCRISVEYSSTLFNYINENIIPLICE